MAKTAFLQWDTVAANNTDLNNVPIDKTVTKASDLEALLQQIMAQLKSGVDPAGTEAATTPTVTASSGTFGAVSCILRYRRDGNKVAWVAEVQSVNKGTATGEIYIPLPIAPAAASSSSPERYAVHGYSPTTGGALTGYIVHTVTRAVVTKYDGTTAIGASTDAVVGGVYFV